MIKTKRINFFLSILSLTIWSCHNESSYDNQDFETFDPHNSVSRITLEDFEDELNADKRLDKVLSLFHPNNEDGSSKNSHKAFSLVRDNVLKITKRWGTSYTIQVVPKNTDPDALFNLVLFANPEGRLIRGHLLKYSPDSYEWLVDPNEPYQGNIEIVQDNLKKLNEILNLENLNTTKCLPTISAGWTCSFGHSHAPGTCNASSYTYEVNISTSCGGVNNASISSSLFDSEDLEGGFGGTGGGDSFPAPNGGGGNDQPPGFDDGNSPTSPIGELLVTFSPDNPINDMNDYLECFNTNQGATITVYALEPNPGSGDTHNGSFVGHTFVSIQQGSNTSTFGFYPNSDNIYPLINNSSSSIMGDDSGDPFTVSVSTTVSSTELNSILNYAKNYESTYHLNTYNCTDFAIEIGNLAGLNLPDAYGTWTMGGGSNPGTLGLHLLNRNSTNNQHINKNGGSAPQSNKGC